MKKEKDINKAFYSCIRCAWEEVSHKGYLSMSRITNLIENARNCYIQSENRDKVMLQDLNELENVCGVELTV